MNASEISLETALRELGKAKAEFVELFEHGSLVVELYKPVEVDKQQPHDRDEVYVIVSGTGIFFKGEKRLRFKTGDFIFVPAGVPHHFEQFTDDFTTWVFFYGPVGGEASS